MKGAARSGAAVIESYAEERPAEAAEEEQNDPAAAVMEDAAQSGAPFVDAAV